MIDIVHHIVKHYIGCLCQFYHCVISIAILQTVQETYLDTLKLSEDMSIICKCLQQNSNKYLEEENIQLVLVHCRILCQIWQSMCIIFATVKMLQNVCWAIACLDVSQYESLIRG